MLQFNNAKNECINVNTKEEIILKKLVSLLEAILLMVMAFPLTALAGQEGTQIISPVFCIPFAGLLLCVAIMPLVKAEWWESHQPHAVVFWSVLFVIPFAIFFGAGEATEKVLECIIDDYLTFIVLLFGLFCVAGNITLEGDLAGSPRINVGLLLLGFFRNYPFLCFPTYLSFASNKRFLQRPYIVRFIIFNRLFVPSTKPLL